MKTTILKQKEDSANKVEGRATGPIILFGNISTPPWEGGGGGGGGPTFPGNDPFPGGDPGSGGPGGGCVGYADWLIGSTTFSDELISEDVNDISPTQRTITYAWVPFKQVANIWRFESRELATQQLISDNWEYTGFSHLGVSVAGVLTGFTYQWIDTTPPATTVTPSVATITLNFRIRRLLYCGGAPFEWDIKFTDGTTQGFAQKSFQV